MKIKKLLDRTNEVIMDINDQLEKYCRDEDITYINLFDLLVDPDQEEAEIRDEYSDDGLHLTEEGYEIVTKEIMKYIEEE